MAATSELGTKTWREALQAVFAPYSSSQEIPDGFDMHAQLSAQGIQVHDTIRVRYDELEPDEKKLLLADLWKLAQDDLSPETRRELYASLSHSYEQFFGWEQDRGPGWLIPS